jgi:hypothetical protein
MLSQSAGKSETPNFPARIKDGVVSPMPPEHQRTSPMHRIFEIQDGLRQIHRFAPILSSRVEMQQEIDNQTFGADDEFKATVSGYELELFSALESDGEYLPVSTPTQLFLLHDMDLAAFWSSTSVMQQQFAELLRFVYD